MFSPFLSVSRCNRTAFRYDIVCRQTAISSLNPRCFILSFYLTYFKKSFQTPRLNRYYSRPDGILLKRSERLRGVVCRERPADNAAAASSCIQKEPVENRRRLARSFRSQRPLRFSPSGSGVLLDTETDTGGPFTYPWANLIMQSPLNTKGEQDV